MPQKAFFPYRGVATLALGVVLSSPAYAGFQWGDRSDTAAVQIASPTLSTTTRSNADGNKSEYISPLVITGEPVAASQPQSMIAAPGPASAPQSIPAPSSAPSAYYSRPAAPQPVDTAGGGDLTMLSVAPTVQPTMAPVQPSGKIDLSSEKISAPAATQDVVHGFASRVPLTLALRQILPADHSFSIDQGIDMDMPVSYKGGKPWGETLKATLGPVGLDYREQGNIVNVVRATAVPPPALAPTAQPLAEKAPVLEPVRQQVSGHFLPYPMPSEKPLNVPSYDGWSAQRGDTLRKVLSGWCSRAGVELKWIAEYDYPVEASAHFSGAFEDAVRALLAGFDQARPQPIGELHVNQKAGQNVLVVQVRGNSYTN